MDSDPKSAIHVSNVDAPVLFHGAYAAAGVIIFKSLVELCCSALSSCADADNASSFVALNRWLDLDGLQVLIDVEDISTLIHEGIDPCDPRWWLQSATPQDDPERGEVTTYLRLKVMAEGAVA